MTHTPVLLFRDAGLQRRIFLKYAELLEAKYARKYAKFGELCGAYMRHICGKMPHICGAFFCTFPAYATLSDGES